MDHDDPWKPHLRLKHVAMQWCSCSAEQGTRSGPRSFSRPKKDRGPVQIDNADIPGTVALWW